MTIRTASWKKTFSLICYFLLTFLSLQEVEVEVGVDVGVGVEVAVGIDVAVGVSLGYR